MNMYLLQWNSAERFNILFNIYFKIFAHSHILQNRREEFDLSNSGLQCGSEEIWVGNRNWISWRISGQIFKKILKFYAKTTFEGG